MRNSLSFSTLFTLYYVPIIYYFIARKTKARNAKEVALEKLLEKYNVDVFVMGDDWKGKFDFLKDYCEVVYLPRTEGISTTQLKEELKG